MSSRKKVLVTGANGLLGRRAINALRSAFDVHGVVHRVPPNCIEGVHYHEVDLSTEWAIDSLPPEIDYVIHLAQSSRFREFPDGAQDVFKVNIESTAKLLRYCNEVNAQRFVLASSGGVYGGGASSFDENSPIVPHHQLGFYLGSKLCAEVMAQNYASVCDVTILRFFFIYGSGQKKSMLIPRLVQNVKLGSPISLQGKDGIKINPVHVNDAVKALEKSLSLSGSHTFNVAGSEVITLRELTDLIGRKLGKKPVYEIVDATPNHLVAENDAMRAHLWDPEINISSGIDELLDEKDA